MQAEGPPGIGGAGNENAPAPAPGAFELQNLRTPAGNVCSPLSCDAFTSSRIHTCYLPAN